MSQRRIAGRNVRPVALGASVVFHGVLLERDRFSMERIRS